MSDIESRRGYLLCPKCEGTKVQATPPGVPPGQSWTTNSVQLSYPCVLCEGRGLVTPEQMDPELKNGDPDKVRVTISVETDADLSFQECELEDITPNEVTADDVMDALKSAGSKHSALSDWGLDDFEISITVKNAKGEYTSATW